MTICHSVELIGYQIQAHWQNNYTVIIPKDQSSKLCQHFSIFWPVIFYLICQVREAKNARWALHWRSPRVKYYKCQKSPTHFCSQHLRNFKAKFHRNLPNFGTILIHLFNWMTHGHFGGPFLQFSFVELKKLAIHIFFRNLHLLSLPTIYSLPCFPSKWRAYEFFSRRTWEDTREGLE